MGNPNGEKFLWFGKFFCGCEGFFSEKLSADGFNWIFNWESFAVTSIDCVGETFYFDKSNGNGRSL